MKTEFNERRRSTLAGGWGTFSGGTFAGGWGASPTLAALALLAALCIHCGGDDKMPPQDPSTTNTTPPEMPSGDSDAGMPATTDTPK
jgi:hypothetical protein